MGENVIVDKTLNFALQIITFTKSLRDNKEFDLASQLFRSGTSIGANVREAQNAESKSDFIHKMKIAAKESEEAIYWLELCRLSEVLPSNETLLNDAIEIRKILNAIIGTSKRGYRNR